MRRVESTSSGRLSRLEDLRPVLALEPQDFPAFFAALHDREPFPWQSRLAKQVFDTGWPAYLKLPTASGKTATLDIAVFHLALEAARLVERGEQVRAARRIFFVVDRRLIVNEAFERMRDVPHDAQEHDAPHMGVARQLNDALFDRERLDDDVLFVAARWLRWLAAAGESEADIALDVVELRGGIYRDDAWVRSPLQPTIVVSTVDQFGSRLLYRGYGVSSRSWPLHAALTARDALVILDEAHCSVPFGETLQNVVLLDKASRAGSNQVDGLALVQMTATPPVGTEDVFKLCKDEDYREGSRLRQRHNAPKPVALVESRASGKHWVRTLAGDLVTEALSLADAEGQESSAFRRIAIIVNRVALAREVHAQLSEKLDRVKLNRDAADLMIGAMRPVDRDRLTQRLRYRFGSERRDDSGNTRFLVSTQCIEVGADLDFDGMVSQVASIDALRQRFGRLNRMGDFDGARGVIVGSASDRDMRKEDPVYGPAMAQTWAWLSTQCDGSPLDFGVRAFEALWDTACAKDIKLAQRLNVLPEHAPTLLPAHMDQLVQTSPRPAPSCDPDISLYLHGPRRPRIEVRVCWRAGLGSLLDPGTEDSQRSVPEAVKRALEVVPPSTAECLTTSLDALRICLGGSEAVDETHTDVEGIQMVGEAAVPEDSSRSRAGVIFRAGSEVLPVHSDNLSVLRPDDVVVLPVELQGWDSLGHLPMSSASDEASLLTSKAESGEEEPESRFRLAAVDVADIAYGQARARLCVRLDKSLARSPAEHAAIDALLKALDEDGTSSSTPSCQQCKKVLERIYESSNPDEVRPLLERFRKLIDHPFTVNRYGPSLAFISARLPRERGVALGGFEDVDLSSEATANTAIPASLEAHTCDVIEQLTRVIEAQPALHEHKIVLLEAALRHDWGKVDHRFQADLRGIQARLLSPEAPVLAKSSLGDDKGRGGRQRELPPGFRHEALSAVLSSACDATGLGLETALLNHLIRSHHGHARPLFPICDDVTPPDAGIALLGCSAEVTSDTRANNIAGHRIDGDTCSDFWRAIRAQGWWGAAWLECQLRLADWAASADPGFAVATGKAPDIMAPSGYNLPSMESVTAIGLDGSNPLGYLAALGLARVLSTRVHPEVRMRWTSHGMGCWVPVYEVPSAMASSEGAFLDALESALDCNDDDHPLVRLDALPAERWLPGAQSAYAASIRPNDELVGLDRWMAANGSEVADPDVNCQLQTARRDYFVGGVRAIVGDTTRQQLHRALFLPWDYADPIEKVSLHLEPREDRRHAYQWDRPSGDPNRKVSGGMVGANRLAMEAWPLFPGKPIYDRKDDNYVIQTLGFEGHRANNIRWVYPIWTGCMTTDALATAMSLSALRLLEREQSSRARHSKRHREEPEMIDAKRLKHLAELERELELRGISAGFIVYRTLVGKTPNFSTANPLFAAKPRDAEELVA